MLWVRSEETLFAGIQQIDPKSPWKVLSKPGGFPVPLGPNKKKLEESVFTFRGIVSIFSAIFELVILFWQINF